MNLNEMTVSELRKIAAQFKVTGRSTMKKAELIDALSAPEVADLVELSTSLDETAAIEADADTMDAITEAEAESDQRPAGHDDSLYIAPGRALVDRTEPGKAIAMISGATFYEADAPAAWLVREGRRWKLVDDYGDEEITVRAGTIAKAVKAWAKRLGLMLDDIVIEKEF